MTMEDLNLDTAQGVSPSNPSCGFCKTALEGQYFTHGQTLLCPACMERHFTGGTGLRSFVKAAGLGVVGALMGALLDFLVTHYSGYQIGLIAIVMGWSVGLGVSLGSRGRGGWLYQILAFALTYFAISISLAGQVFSAYSSDEFEEPASVVATASAAASATPADLPSALPSVTPVPESTPTSPAETEQAAPNALGMFLGLAAAMVMLGALPVMVGMEAPISLLIYGFALYQAVIINRRVEVGGPYQVGQRQGEHSSPPNE